MNAKTVNRALMAAIIIGSVICYFVFDLGRYFSLEALKASRADLLALYASRPVMVIAVYFILYVVVTALAFPAATAISLAGGAVFGVVAGTIIVSFASTIGAAVAFIVARYLLRDWVQNRFGERLAKVNRGIEEEGAYYLFTLRLIPVFPFFVVNTVVALTPMRLSTYYWVSQVGMFPATVIYVFAGRELGRINSLSDLLSPGLVTAFVLLGIFPLAVKKLLGWYQQAAKRQNGEER
jgi:uncharacterized membrane protein YdjX (TVP38/TMEM64 family)